jgi:hypothetical protein
MIERWSFSRLNVYESCNKRGQLAYSEKLPEIRRPDGNKAADRGTRVHEAGEHYIKGDTNIMIPELKNFEDEFEHARALNDEQFSSEQTWYFDEEWNPTVNLADRWLTVIIDLLVWIDDYEAVAIDFKTGKRYGNEIKHGQQIQLYQLATLLRYPDTDFITTEIWYLDQDELASQKYKRRQGLRFLESFNKRGVAITTDVEFKAKPSTYSCRFCPYRSGANKWVCGTGDCTLNPPDPTELPEVKWHEMLEKLR